MNGHGKLRRCTERNARIVDLYLTAALVTIRQLIQACPQAPPLGHPAHDQATEMIPIAGHS